MKHFRFFCVVLSFSSLIIGLSIYIFLRDGTHLHKLVSSLSAVITVSAFACSESSICIFLKYYFVDFLWGLALSFALCAVQSIISKRSIIVSCGISTCAGTAFEICQLLSLCDGTFDFVDILMYFAAAVFAAALNIKIIMKPRRRT